MLHELLFALLGFTGDVIIAAEDEEYQFTVLCASQTGTFRVKDGFDLLKEAEREQINRIAPLGWFYCKLQAIIQQHDVAWGRSRSRYAVYKVAMARGIADLLEEYVADISYLEQLILAEGPIPLSQVQQHLQKYSLIFPPLYELLCEVERRKLNGCQILDFFGHHTSGVPVLNQVIDRLVLRLRVVFVKQCFAWMIHGELEDPQNEFFIQAKQQHHCSNDLGFGASGKVALGSFESNAVPGGELYSNVLNRLYTAKMKYDKTTATADGLGGRHHSANISSKLSFDWTSSYYLSLERIPSSHVSPRIASKILFAGKAVKLLHSSPYDAVAMDDSSMQMDQANTTVENVINPYGLEAESLHEAYKYLSKEYIKAHEVMEIFQSARSLSESRKDQHVKQSVKAIDEKDVQDTPSKAPTPDQVVASPSESKDDNNVANPFTAFSDYSRSGGYTATDVTRFIAQFQRVLLKPQQAVEVLETVVEDINDSISNRLWILLRNQLGFVSFVHVIRNTYLLGKGELFQALLDGVLALTFDEPPDPLEMDTLLNWKVLRSSAKLVGLINDDSITGMIRLRVNSSDVLMRNFSHFQSDIILNGAAFFSGSKGEEQQSRGGQNTLPNALLLCQMPQTSPDEKFERVWSKALLKRSRGSIALSGHSFHMPGEEDDTADFDMQSIESDEHMLNESNTSYYAPDTPLETANKTTIRQRYCSGSFILQDQKQVSRGFNWRSKFLCTWAAVRANITSKYPAFSDMDLATPSNLSHIQGIPTGRRELLLGVYSCCMHSDRRGTSANQGSIITPQHGGLFFNTPAGTIVAGVAIYAFTHSSLLGVKYYGRLFVRSATSLRSECGDDYSSPSIRSSDLFRQRQLNLSVGSHNSIYSRTHPVVRSAAANEGVVFSDEIIDIDDNLRDIVPASQQLRSISSAAILTLEVEYKRDSANASSAGSSAASISSGASIRSNNQTTYLFTVRLDQGRYITATSSVRSAGRSTSGWSLELPLELQMHVRCSGGQAFTGVYALGMIFPNINSGTVGLAGKLNSQNSKTTDRSMFSPLATQEKLLHTPSSAHNEQATVDVPLSSDWELHPKHSFCYQIVEFFYSGVSVASSYPVASAYTISRFPDTTSKIATEMNNFRAWMNIKLQLSLPPLFRVIFDSDAVVAYERIFSLVMKVRLVAHALERLWIARSQLITDRIFCQIRHSMHFFISNLLYYLQVDVVDAEYCTLYKEIMEAKEFQDVLRTHRQFLSNVMRLSLIDNASIQEGIERILQVCIRFIAICRILHQSEFHFIEKYDEKMKNTEIVSSSTVATAAAGQKQEQSTCTAVPPPIYIPPEEFEAIRKDFFSHVESLFRIMRKVESRGFIFRLDFNNYISNLLNN